MDPVTAETEARLRLSACIIAYNEESNIADCLASVAWCDEIVVVDSFSQDRTADIARAAGARVIRSPWAGHVAQKQKALAAARGDWVLALDCDERVTPKLRQRIEEALAASDGAGIDGYYLARQLFYLGRWLEHGGWFPEWRLRLFRSRRGRWVGVDPHDTVEVEGRTARLDPGGSGAEAAVILHHSFRDLSHQLKVLDRYSGIQSGELLRLGRRVGLGDLLFRPLWRFILSYLLRGGFLDGLAGYHMAVNHAYAAYMKYARLWELEKGLVAARAKEEALPAAAEGPAASAEGRRS